MTSHAPDVQCDPSARGQMPLIKGRQLPPVYVAGAVVAVVFANVYFAYWSIAEALTFGGQTDWRLSTIAGARAVGGANPFEPYFGYFGWRWSPLLAYLFGLIAWVPFWAWALVHLVAAFGFRDWRMTAAVLVSWPFILDTIDGGIMIFVALSAWWAYRASNFGTVAFFALSLMVPRPMMLPLLVWILWKRPQWRVSFIAIVLAHTGAVLVTGWGDEWIARLFSLGTAPVVDPVNIGPSRWLGIAWIPLGLALGAWLTWRGWLGLASLAASPYVLPPYLLMLVLDLRRNNDVVHGRSWLHGRIDSSLRGREYRGVP